MEYLFVERSTYENFGHVSKENCNPINTLNEFGLKLNKDCRGKKIKCKLYKQVMGNLMYLKTKAPDIMHSLSLINRYTQNPTKMHLLAAK